MYRGIRSGKGSNTRQDGAARRCRLQHRQDEGTTDAVYNTDRMRGATDAVYNTDRMGEAVGAACNRQAGGAVGTACNTDRMGEAADAAWLQVQMINNGQRCQRGG